MIYTFLAHSSGREWSKHKYIGKTRTKSGKIRYIYKDGNIHKEEVVLTMEEIAKMPDGPEKQDAMRRYYQYAEIAGQALDSVRPENTPLPSDYSKRNRPRSRKRFGSGEAHARVVKRGDTPLGAIRRNMVHCDIYSDELYHHGIQGQKWGVRRFQNKDGTRTDAGKKRYSLNESYKDFEKKQNRLKRVTNFKMRGLRAAAVTTMTTGGVAGTLAAGPAGGLAGSVAGGIVGAKVFGSRANKVAYEATAENERLIKEKNPVKNNEILIKSGDKFVRVSLKSEETDGKRMYVGYDKDKFSADYYKNVWPKYLKKFANNPNAEVYQNSYKVKTDIVAPSLEKRKEIALKLVNTDKKLATELGKTYATDQLRLATGMYEFKSLKEIKNTALTKYGKEAANGYQKYYDTVVKEVKSYDDNTKFKAFTASIPTSDKLMNAYIKELKKSGYNAVFDDNANSPAPFIVFDPKDLEQTGSKRLS